MKVTFWIETGYAGCGYEETFDVADDATEEDLENMMQDFLSNHIDYGYYTSIGNGEF